MRKKLKLDPERLEVSSFDTSEVPGGARGTVHGNDACTCKATCVCPSAIYWCAEIAYTVYSCDYTNWLSCRTAAAD
jgi:hypothetical protein